MEFSKYVNKDNSFKQTPHIYKYSKLSNANRSILFLYIEYRKNKDIYAEPLISIILS